MPVFTEPVWEEPQHKTKLSKYERVLTPLMSRHGEWGKIGEYKSENSAYQAALNLRRGEYRIPGEPGDWEFLAEDVEVFAKYLGENGGYTKTVTKVPAKKSTKKKG